MSGKAQIIIKGHYIYDQTINVRFAGTHSKIMAQVFSAISLMAHHSPVLLRCLFQKIGKSLPGVNANTQRQEVGNHSGSVAQLFAQPRSKRNSQCEVPRTRESVQIECRSSVYHLRQRCAMGFAYRPKNFSQVLW